MMICICHLGLIDVVSHVCNLQNLCRTLPDFISHTFHKFQTVISITLTSKLVPASTRLEDPSRKGTTRTAKSAPFNPCPSREGPYSTVFSVSRPMDPLMWLAGLLALSGDVETNPGPTTQTWTCDMCLTEITRRQTSYKCNSSPSHWVHKHCTTLIRNTDYTPTWKCNIHNQQNNTITDQHHQLTDNSNNMQQNQNINQPHSINNNKSQQQINSKKTITIIQININGLTTKINELKNLTDNTKIDIITIQETKLKPTHRTPYLKDYTAIRTDRTYKNGGGLKTYIKNDIIFTELKTPHTTNNKLTELQHIKIHLANHKHLNIFQYIHTSKRHYKPRSFQLARRHNKLYDAHTEHKQHNTDWRLQCTPYTLALTHHRQ